VAQVRQASASSELESAGLLSPSEGEHFRIAALCGLALGGAGAVLALSDDHSALELSIFLVVVVLALASVFLNVEAHRRRVMGHTQLLRSAAETTVDMHRMIGRFRHDDVDARLLDDARAALVDARELGLLLGRDRPEVQELAHVASELQEMFATSPPPRHEDHAR
jgi:hypothetical protein